MKFNVNQQDLQKALNYCQGIIEKRSTLPILSNVLLDISNSKLTLTATDLDLIFIHEIPNVEILEEASCLYTLFQEEGRAPGQYFVGITKVRIIDTGEIGWTWSNAVAK